MVGKVIGLDPERLLGWQTNDESKAGAPDTKVASTKIGPTKPGAVKVGFTKFGLFKP